MTTFIRSLIHRLSPLIERIREDENLVRLIQHSGLLYASGIITIGLTFAQQISTASLLGAADFGRFAAVMSSRLLIQLLVSFRTLDASTKFLAQSLDDHDDAEAANVAQTMSWYVLIDVVAGMIGVLLMLLLAGPIATHLLDAPDTLFLVQLVALTIPFRLIALGVPNGMLRLYDHFGLLSAKSVAFALVRLILITGAAVLGFGLFGVIVGAIVAEIFHAAMMLVLMAVTWRQHRPNIRLFQFGSSVYLLEHIKLMGNLWLNGTVNAIQRETLIPILALLASPADVGVFRIGLDTALLIRRLIDPILIALQPKILSIYEQASREEFLNFIKRSTILLTFLVSPITLGMIIVGPFVLPHLLGDEFAGAAEITAILALAIGLEAVFSWLWVAMVAVNRIAWDNAAVTLRVILTVGGLLLIVPTQEALGAAIVRGAVGIVIIVLRFMLFWYAIRLEDETASSEVVLESEA
ncbi:MAG: lipopolysaccharide biosynthesis protein [Chloroflexi bacterium]|nr:MAG: lipopolysaccharide biosynthesis protein [Chloroflexota bacterium]